jgi:hypothetical protein
MPSAPLEKVGHQFLPGEARKGRHSPALGALGYKIAFLLKEPHQGDIGYCFGPVTLWMTLPQLFAMFLECSLRFGSFSSWGQRNNEKS